MDPKNEKPATKSTKGGYGKRPLWQWILLYVIIGAIVYFLVYILFFHHSSGSSSGGLYNY